MKKIGILTTIEANHGSCIFNASLYQLIKGVNQENDVKFLHFLFTAYRFKELMRTLKVNSKIPFYNLRRTITLDRFTKKETPLETFHGLKNLEELLREIDLKGYSTLIVGKVVWDIAAGTPLKFPNVYWLSETIKAKKIAYAISGHRTDLELFKQRKTEAYKYLSNFQLIGVRDDMTQTMMEVAGIDKITPIYRISDPAFLYEPDHVDPQVLLKRYKISPDRPILGLLYYGKENISQRICEVYHKKGYQIINFNMFNPYADINIGHRISPDEWLALIKQLSFCITDRFHISVFCLREDIPFIGIEPYQPKTLLNSKVYSVLKDFEIEKTCYQDTYKPEFNLDYFLSQCDQIEKNWKTDLSAGVRSRLISQNQNQRNFLELVHQIIESS